MTMSKPEQFTPGPIDALIADFKINRKRLKEHTPKSIKELTDELCNNVYPSMIALAEQIAEVDDIMQETIEQQDSYLQQEAAAQILHTVALAGGLLVEVEKIVPTLDDMTKKRVEALIKDLEQSMELTSMVVTDATVDFDTEDEEGTEDEDEDEDEEEEEEIVIPENPVGEE
jgi:sugar-specific transcriptional regulator TrmB